MRIKRLLEIAARLGSIGAVALTLAACGAVSGTPAATVVLDLLVLPASADMFSELPTQFSISGGTPPYSVFSNNNAVLPLESAVNGTTFFAIPAIVASDTKVTITARDVNNKTKDVLVTVRPAVLNNTVTFTALPQDGVGCGSNILCSGGSAQVVVTAMLNNTVLQNRAIRFDVYQGDFKFVTPLTGVLVNTFTVNTDERGEALVRLTAAVGAPTQVATLTLTDIASGLVRRFSFNIVSRTLSVLPGTDLTVTGPAGATGGFSPVSNLGQCPNGLTADFYIFGGAPPYRVVSPLPSMVLVGVPGSGFSSEAIVTASGGRVIVTVIGCGSMRLIVTDANGTLIQSSLIIGVKGPDGVGTTTIPVVSPISLTFAAPPAGCNTSGAVTLTGAGSWTGTIATVGGSPGISITPTNGIMPATVTVTRSSNPSLTNPPTPLSVTIIFASSAGTTPLTVNTTLTGNCP